MSRFFAFLGIFLAIYLVSLPDIGRAQSVNLGIPPVLNYSKQDFKGGTQVWDVTQDRNGYMWFGNNSGILEFDGVHWRLHPLPNKTIVRSVHASPNGWIFAGGQDEFGYFTATADGSLQYHSLKPALPESEQHFGDVWNIYENADGVFFRTSQQVFRYFNGQVSSLCPPGSTIHFLGLWAGKLTIQLQDYQLLFFENGKLQPFDRPFESRLGAISGMIQYAPDTILVTTLKNGIYWFDGSNFIPWVTDNDAFLRTNTIFCAGMLRDGKIALGTSLNGLVVLDRQRRLYYHLNKKNGLQNNTILSLYPSDEGGLWLGLDNGIDYVDIHSPLTTVFPDGDLQGTGYTAQVFKNKIYFGTNTGLYAIDWKPFYSPEDRLKFFKLPHSEGQVWSLNDINGSLLMGHHEGAFEIKGLDAVKLTSLQGVWKFVSIGPDIAIAGHYNGLASFRKTASGWTFGSTLPGLSESSRLIARDSSGFIWMAHPYRGIFKISLNPDMTIREAGFYGQNQGFPSDLGNHLFSLNGTIVFTGEHGVYGYQPNRDRFVPDEYFQRIFGDKTQVRYLRQDQEGNIWYVTDRETGILVVENYTLAKQVRRIPIPELNEKLTGGFQFVLPIDRQNAFVATEKGFIHINPSAYFVKDTLSRLILQEVRLKSGPDSVLYGGHATGLADKQRKIKLAVNQNSITFAFSALNFRGTDLVRYSHFLEGLDDQWSPWASETDVTFTNLPPGKYIFHIKAKNKYGIESVEKAFAFTINPPWYASRLAYALYLLSVLALIAGIIYRQSREFDREKKGLVSLHNQQTRFSEEAINRLQNEKLEAEVRHKNQELASATLHLVQKSEMLNTIKSGLEKLKAGSGGNAKLEKEIMHLIRILESDTRTDSDWELFSHRFDQVHGDFLRRLGEQKAHLSPNDYKLCAYLRMNLSSKEIATLMNISLRGVESSRYRLRKRLGLDTDENLTEFLMRV